MAEIFLPNAPDLSVELRRSAAARRISLRISRLDGRVTLTIPRNLPEREAIAFAESKAAWLRRNLADRPESVRVTFGTELPVQGELKAIVADSCRKAVLSANEIRVPKAAKRPGARVQDVLKSEARRLLTEASDHYAEKLGRGYSKITLRDTRSRWGSCSSRGALMFSWRLVMAPEEVLHYVAAHEVAHLAEMNHSEAFWSVVADIYGPHKDERKWLRQHGEKLHRYSFDD